MTTSNPTHPADHDNEPHDDPRAQLKELEHRMETIRRRKLATITAACNPPRAGTR